MEHSAALWLFFIKKAHLGYTHTHTKEFIHSYRFPFKVQIVLYVTLFISFPLLNLGSPTYMQTNRKCKHWSLVSKAKNSSEVSRDSCRPLSLGRRAAYVADTPSLGICTLLSNKNTKLKLTWTCGQKRTRGCEIFNRWKCNMIDNV